ncbi:MAG: acetyl-CoA acetyltransferase [Alphaproteobacteria bacterium]
MNDADVPVLVGSGQVTGREEDPSRALEPIDLMAEAARRAAASAGLAPEALGRLDRIAVVNLLSWRYGNAPRSLAARLGASPREEIYTTIGGNTPQSLVNRTAADIAAGRVEMALIAGGEAMATLRRAQKAKLRLAWSGEGEGRPESFGDARDGTCQVETDHGLMMPVVVYPLFENAIRASRGRSIADHSRHVARLCSRLSEVAAGNEHAWFRQRRTPEEIATPGPANRMIAFPYTKLMNSILDVDQGSAVLMTSTRRARELGVPEDRLVHLHGSADAHDLWFVSERTGYAHSPAIRAAGRRALERAGCGIADVDLLDLYSCFPSAVQLACEALGIADDDPRPLTVTGGLACFGGPGNAYTLNAIAEMTDRLRAAPGRRGLVTGLGWYATKHSVGIYGTERPASVDAFGQGSDPAADEALQRAIDAQPHPGLAAEPAGDATIETSTVAFDRDGAPMRGIVIGRLVDGRRFLANTPPDRDVMESLTTRETVGTRGRVTPGSPNVFVPA